MAKKVAKISIDKCIGETDPFMLAFAGVSDTFSSNDMDAFLNANTDADEIDVDVNTNGGSTSHGYTIHDLLVNSGKTITTRALKANSIGTVIFLAGSTRNITKNAEFYIHCPHVDAYNIGGVLTADDATALAESLQAEETKMIDFYAEKLKWDDATKTEVYDLMKKETNLGADGALKYGFATAIINGNAEAKIKPLYWDDKIAAIVKKNSQTKIDMTKIVTKEEFTAGMSGLQKTMNALMKKFKIKADMPDEDPTAEAGSVMLEDGTTAIYFDGTAIGDGIKVFSDEAMTVPLPAKDYKTADGDTFTIAGDDGMISNFVDAAETASLEDANAQIATLQQEATEKDETIAELKKQFGVMATKIETLSKFVPGQINTPQAKVVDYSKMSPGQKAAMQTTKDKELKKA